MSSGNICDSAEPHAALGLHKREVLYVTLMSTLLSLGLPMREVLYVTLRSTFL
jgi:hypothetical protein